MNPEDSTAGKPVSDGRRHWTATRTEVWGKLPRFPRRPAGAGTPGTLGSVGAQPNAPRGCGEPQVGPGLSKHSWEKENLVVAGNSDIAWILHW